MSTAEAAGQPAWCHPQHCYRTDEGVVVHHQAPARLEAQCVVPLRIETCLIDPGDDDTTYLELRMRDLTLRDQFYGLLTLDTARRLRDQLTCCPGPPSGTCGRRRCARPTRQSSTTTTRWS